MNETSEIGCGEDVSHPPDFIDGHHVEGGVAEEHLGLPLRLLRGGGGLLQREARTRAHRGAEDAEAGGQDLHLQTPSSVPYHHHFSFGSNPAHRLELETKANQRLAKISQSRRRLLGQCPFSIVS